MERLRSILDAAAHSSPRAILKMTSRRFDIDRDIGLAVADSGCRASKVALRRAGSLRAMKLGLKPLAREDAPSAEHGALTRFRSHR
jgi:hypothetical protein